MKIMVIGGGGREHAIIRALRKNRDVETVYALPGNAGMEDTVCVNVAATDLEGVVAFTREHRVDLAVVTPDDPLVLGMVDLLEAEGIPCFGPRRNAAILEGSKVFAKTFMKRWNIPTAAWEVFGDAEAAKDYVQRADLPLVIKADGLALGKGVIIAKTREEALEAVDRIMVQKVFGKSGERVIVEEFLEGPEVTLLTLTDGESLVPLLSSMDHKRAGDGDTGLNTGGMGCIAPNPFYTPQVHRRCMEEICLPTIRGMAAEGRPFRGCLYFGLMLTEKGPKVIEYNCRFGDPEAQTILPLMETDLLQAMLAVTQNRLGEEDIRFSSDSSCCVILASAGYPGKYEKGREITVPGDLLEHVYMAGVAREKGKLVTSGGRVMGVLGRGASLSEAVHQAYARVDRIEFENRQYRRDIGQRALAVTGGK